MIFFVERLHDFFGENLRDFVCVERLCDFFTHSLGLHDLSFWRRHDVFAERLHTFFVERLRDFLCGELA